MEHPFKCLIWVLYGFLSVCLIKMVSSMMLFLALNVVKNTRQKYVTLCRRLTEFGQITRWEHLSVEAIYKWDAWLHSQEVTLTENQARAGVESAYLGYKAVESYHKCLRAMLNRQTTDVSIAYLNAMLDRERVNDWFTRFCAGAVCVAVPISILYIITQKFYQEAMSGSVKG